MDNYEKQLQNLSQIKLESSAKERIRGVLQHKITNTELCREMNNSRPAALSFNTVWLRYVAAPLLILFVFTGISEAALPGQSLYWVKTDVNEPLRNMVSFSADSKIELQKDLIQERVKEAKSLKEKGLLTPLVSLQIEEKIEKHSQTAQGEINEIKEEEEASLERSRIEGQVAGSKNAIRVLSGNEPIIDTDSQELEAELADEPVVVDLVDETLDLEVNSDNPDVDQEVDEDSTSTGPAESIDRDSSKDLSEEQLDMVGTNKVLPEEEVVDQELDEEEKQKVEEYIQKTTKKAIEGLDDEADIEVDDNGPKVIRSKNLQAERAKAEAKAFSEIFE